MSLRPSGESPFATLAQSLGRLPVLLRNMDPTWTLADLQELNAVFVRDHAITGIVWDVDGTLTAYHARELLPGATATLTGLAAVDGLRHAILSNAPEWRVRELARMFPSFPIIRGYTLDGQVLPRQLLGEADTWSPEELEARLRAGAVALRKPSPDLVRLAVAALDRPAGEVVMVGDQHLTDVAGARLAGVRSIKVHNPSRSTFPLSIRFTQRLEALLFRVFGGRG